jgi:hypothetical protein
MAEENYSLEEKLANVRAVMKDLYSDALFVLPENCKYDEGIYHYTVKLLRGSGQIFNKRPLDTLLPMSSGQVHVLHTGHFKPLKLLPFVRIMGSPGAEQTLATFTIDSRTARPITFPTTSSRRVKLIEQIRESNQL